jgi:hypothetical protein
MSEGGSDGSAMSNLPLAARMPSGPLRGPRLAGGDRHAEQLAQIPPQHLANLSAVVAPAIMSQLPLELPAIGRALTKVAREVPGTPPIATL